MLPLSSLPSAPSAFTATPSSFTSPLTSSLSSSSQEALHEKIKELLAENSKLRKELDATLYDKERKELSHILRRKLELGGYSIPEGVDLSNTTERDQEILISGQDGLEAFTQFCEEWETFLLAITISIEKAAHCLKIAGHNGLEGISLRVKEAIDNKKFRPCLRRMFYEQHKRPVLSHGNMYIAPRFGRVMLAAFLPKITPLAATGLLSGGVVNVVKELLSTGMYQGKSLSSVFGEVIGKLSTEFILPSDADSSGLPKDKTQEKSWWTEQSRKMADTQKKEQADKQVVKDELQYRSSILDAVETQSEFAKWTKRLEQIHLGSAAVKKTGKPRRQRRGDRTSQEESDASTSRRQQRGGGRGETGRGKADKGVQEKQKGKKKENKNRTRDSDLSSDEKRRRKPRSWSDKEQEESGSDAEEPARSEDWIAARRTQAMKHKAEQRRRAELENKREQEREQQEGERKRRKEEERRREEEKQRRQREQEEEREREEREREEREQQKQLQEQQLIKDAEHEEEKGEEEGKRGGRDEGDQERHRDEKQEGGGREEDQDENTQKPKEEEVKELVEADQTRDTIQKGKITVLSDETESDTETSQVADSTDALRRSMPTFISDPSEAWSREYTRPSKSRFQFNAGLGSGGFQVTDLFTQLLSAPLEFEQSRSSIKVSFDKEREKNNAIFQVQDQSQDLNQAQ